MRDHIIFTFLLSLLCIASYSQIVFEDGYYIDDADQRTNCLIRNIDWKDNPREFDIKATEDGNMERLDIKTVKEFGVIGVSRFIRAAVDIDRSSDDLQLLNSERNPVFQKDTLFLKVIIEGKASLSEYVDGNLVRFFYKMDDGDIIQMVYKRYYNQERIITSNFQYKQQLLVDLSCEAINKTNIEKLRYAKKDLAKLFVDYNECTGSGFVDYDPKQKRDLFHLTLRPGVDFHSLALQIPEVTDFGNRINFRFGIEAEYVLPYNKNKWAIILEPTFQSFKSEKTTEVATGSVPGETRAVNAEVNYQSIELPIGARHYFFLNDHSKIFINATYSFHFDLNSNVELTREADGSSLRSMDITSGSTFSFGAGYKYNDKLSVEMRYQMKRDIFANYSISSSDYKTFSIIFGYTLF